MICADAEFRSQSDRSQRYPCTGGRGPVGVSSRRNTYPVLFPGLVPGLQPQDLMVKLWNCNGISQGSLLLHADLAQGKALYLIGLREIPNCRQLNKAC